MHIQALVDQKRAGRAHRAIDRLHHAAPSAERLFQLAAERGVNLGSLTLGLIDLLNTHGATALERAVHSALAENAAHLAAVRHFIDLEHARRGQPPPIPISLPDDPRVRALIVRPHRLTDYEQLAREKIAGANFLEADFGDVAFRGATYDDSTQFPTGFIPSRFDGLRSEKE